VHSKLLAKVLNCLLVIHLRELRQSSIGAPQIFLVGILGFHLIEQQSGAVQSLARNLSSAVFINSSADASVAGGALAAGVLGWLVAGSSGWS